VLVILAIALGGAAGSVLRYGLGRAVQPLSPTGFPVGTLAVNVLGCILVGALSRYFLNHEAAHRAVQPALIVGLCGGFTTFSAFSLETVGLLSGGAVGKAAFYVGLSLTACLAGTAIGFFAARP
jgi:fluoride exporter